MHTILIPGLACSARLWDTLMPTAWAHGGTSIADTRRDDTITGMAERLLVDAPPLFALAGISMGGYVCLEVVRLAPDRVQGLALISTAAAADTPEQTRSRQEQSAMVRAGRFDDLVQAAYFVLVDAHNIDNPDLKRLWTTMAKEVGVEAFLNQLNAATNRSDNRPLLPAITCPVAVVHGTSDQTIAVQNAYDMAAAIPHAQLTTVEGAGHMATHERPEAVTRAFAALLDEVQRGPY